MYAITPAWHGLGTVIDHAPNAAEAFKLAGLDWEVETRPIYTKGIDDAGNDTFKPIENRVATVRADTNQVLGVVSNIYKIVQNWEAFQFVDKLIDSGDVRYESAGAVKGGKIVWCLARLPDRHYFVSDGDSLARFLLLYNGHDGSNAVKIVPTSVRVVCWNTISLADPSINAEAAGDEQATKAMAANKRSGGSLTISHVQNLRFKVEDARRLLSRTNEQFDAFADEARKLSQVRITMAQFDSFLERLIPRQQPARCRPIATRRVSASPSCIGRRRNRTCAAAPPGQR